MLCPGVGNRGVGGYTPLAGKILNIPPLRILEKYTPLGGAKRRPHFFGRNSKINVNLTGFRLNLVKLTLI